MPSTPKPTVVNEVVDPIGDRTAISQRKKVIPIDMGVLSHCVPLFLKLPMSSFFLQSMEMIGLPCCSKARQVLLMCSNWASRSGCEVPSMLFLFACKENPRSCKISANADFLI